MRISNFAMDFKPLRVLKEYGGTRITLGRDFGTGLYLIEKSATTADKFVAQLIENEMHIYEGLHHRHIVKYFGEGPTPLSFLIEYAPFGSLGDYLAENWAKKGALEHFLMQILMAVSYLHDNGIVHNDINNSNFLVFENNRCKLTDFAMAGRIGTPAFPTHPDGFRIGTIGYRSSDRILYNDTKNDIYSLGKLIYKFATGHSVEEPMDFTGLEPPYPEVITKCLQMSYSTPEEISDNLGLSGSPEFLY